MKKIILSFLIAFIIFGTAAADEVIESGAEVSQGISVEPGAPSEPGEPGEPKEPGEPGEPKEPGEPGEPKEPGESEEPENPGESEEPGKYAEIITDELEDFGKTAEHSGGVIYDKVSDSAPFHGDESIMQRTDKSEQYIKYEIPYWEKAEITAYFYGGEEINHFIFKCGETVIEPETNITSEDGKWHKVEYSFENPVCTEKSLYIYWQDLTETDFTNWGQALGSVRVYTAFPKPCTLKYLSDTVFPIPDEGYSDYTLSAEVCDQNGDPLDEEIFWECEAAPDGVSFDTEAAVLKISPEAADKSEIEIKIRTETLEPVSVVISFKSYKPGDINGDFKIDETDLELALQNYRKPDNTRGDINKNGITDIYDLAYIKKNFGNLD